jgi:hypothetical protein
VAGGGQLTARVFVAEKNGGPGAAGRPGRTPFREPFWLQLRAGGYSPAPWDIVQPSGHHFRTGCAMTDQPGWAPPGVDSRRANTARVYDYWLGGSRNFLADQDLGRAMAAIEPNVRAITRANRAFLGRAVRFLAANGIRQFLDIGSGIPTQANVHEVAQLAAPGSRVAYVDLDPVAVAHSKFILAGHDAAVAIEGDLRAPEKILTSPASAG